ncbi:MAG TPA: hypothetical protein VF815_14415, partial [Myxococcaceae bacterium]
MAQSNSHSDTVKAWCEGWRGTLPPPVLVDVYERALNALWRRAHMSLGEITLVAIVARVLHHGVERFPHLTALKVDSSGVRFGTLILSAEAFDVALLEESLVFLVVELLRVLGTLTGEILT